MQPSQPARGVGIAGIPVAKPGIHLPQKPAARRGCESRDQANGNGQQQAASHGNGHRADYTGNGQGQEIATEHRAQQQGDRWDVQPHQQKGRRRQQEIKHRKQQDDSGEQGDVIWHHPNTLSFPRRASFSGGIHNNIRLELLPTPLGFGRMRLS